MISFLQSISLHPTHDVVNIAGLTTCNFPVLRKFLVACTTSYVAVERGQLIGAGGSIILAALNVGVRLEWLAKSISSFTASN